MRDGMDYVDIIVLLTTLIITGFWITYGLFFKWWKTAPGRAVFLFFGAPALFLIAGVMVLTLGPDYPGREFVRLFTALYALVTGSYLFYTLVASWWRTGRVLDLEARARHAREALEQSIREGNS